MRVSRLAVLITLVATTALSLGAQGTAPGKSWPIATPAALGLNRAVLDSLDSEIKAGRYGYVDRMLVIRHGKIAFDASYPHDYDKAYGDSARVKSALNPGDPTGPYNYYAPWWHPTYRRGDLHTLQSVTKTVTSVIIGAAIARGDFPSIDTPVLNFFDTTHVANIDARKRRMTVKHLLTMTGGFDWNENLPYVDPRNTAVVMEGSHDWIQYVIDRPMAREPGATWNYSSGESALLAHIFRQATGVDIEEYAAKYLFAPIGIERWYWKRTPNGIADTEGGLYLEARDLARVWQLFALDGMWNGTRVVSHEWITASTSPQIAVGSGPTSPKYGLKWWLYPDQIDATKLVWSGSGFGGQLPMYFPSQDLLVVFNGWNILPGKGSIPLRKTMERLQKAVVK
ncbi:MAG: serine hydrolase [Gemmatimonadota bacterium]